MAEPKIFTKNYLDAQDTITSTHGGTLSRLYDRDTVLQWVSTGANSDLTTVTIDVDFIADGTPQTRTIDTVFLLNHNVKALKFYTWNGSTFVQLFAKSAESTSTMVHTEGTPVATTKVRIELETTQTADQEKAIGEMIVCGLTMDIGTDLSQYDIRWREKSSEIVLGDGSIHKVLARAATGRLSRYQASARFRYLSVSQRNALKAIKEAGEPVYFQPESVNAPGEVYFVHWANPWDEQFSSVYKGAGYDVRIDFKEV